MTDQILPVFLGGSADSGKSAMMSEIARRREPEVAAFSISEFFRVALADRAHDTDHLPHARMGSEVALIDWKSVESQAIDYLLKSTGSQREEIDKTTRPIPAGLPKCFKSTQKTAILNTHFATYSAGGFMVGLDPPSLRAICETCQLFKPQTGEVATGARAAVVLVDIGIADVLHRREANWTKDTDDFMTGAAVAQDLEFNRLYALQYFNTLALLLGHSRVFYKRVFIDYEERGKKSGPPLSIREFKDAVDELEKWLEEKQFLKTGQPASKHT